VPIRPCEVTADSDPHRSWVEIKAASSVFEAAAFYEAFSAAPPMGCAKFPRPSDDTVFTIRIDGREYRVRRSRMMAWANAKAEKAAGRQAPKRYATRGDLWLEHPHRRQPKSGVNVDRETFR
jgi:hypothetical protein